VTPTEIILGKIRVRYSAPKRTAYLYLFLLKPDANRNILIPSASDVVAAWVDEGNGLTETPIEQALQQTIAAREFRTARPTSAHERRLSMARIVTLTVEAQAVDQYSVDLFSRALAFSPKGDRRALETWRPAEGSWYSAPIGRE
jgi:hypothetical protein